MPEEIIILSDDDSVDEPTVKKRKIEESNGPSEYIHTKYLHFCKWLELTVTLNIFLASKPSEIDSENSEDLFKEPVNFQSNGTSISNTNGTGTPLLKKTARKKPSSFTPRFDVPEVIDLDDDEPNKAPENQHPEFGNVKQATDQFLKGIFYFTVQCEKM